MDRRRKYLIEKKGEALTKEEVADGYHFCKDWDGLLVGPDDPEVESCTCKLVPRCETCDE